MNLRARSDLTALFSSERGSGGVHAALICRPAAAAAFVLLMSLVRCAAAVFIPSLFPLEALQRQLSCLSCFRYAAPSSRSAHLSAFHSLF